ncbi:MAG TPA: hypothetical protein VJ783_32360 [Pirellulales bacterium]|nr:hypothetical protein [Pirellulales bacterium]
MPFNRIRGFYIRPLTPPEPKSMSIEEKNNELNSVIKSGLDLLNNVIEQHEKALRAMTVVRDVSCVYAQYDQIGDNGQPTGYEEVLLIGVLKRNGSWRLCHGYHHTGDPSGETDWKPLADSSVAERLRAVPHIDKLRQAIIDDKIKLLPEIIESFQSAVKSLEAYPGGAKLASGYQAAIQRLQGKDK